MVFFRIKKQIKDLIKVMRNIEHSANLLRGVGAKDSLLILLTEKIKAEKIDNVLKEENRYYIPREIKESKETYKIGSALVMANHYGLEFEIGTCFGDCRVFLKKENWLNPLDKSLPTTDYGTWMIGLPGEVESIYAYGPTVLEAILKCLLNARIAGVI